jgi:minor extracellular serine protease Vpr
MLLIVRALLGVVLLLAVAAPAAAAPAMDEVVVQLRLAPLAGARGQAAVERGRILDAAEHRLEQRILSVAPDARFTWRYRRVVAGLAVVVPHSAVPRVARLPGVEAVYPSVRYSAGVAAGPVEIGAPSLWGAGLSQTAGRGIKIGIIDQGVDPSNPYFNPAGFTPPPGFPKGNRRFTTAKIIVARAFAPPSVHDRRARLPFDPRQEHGTHVAGIAAGNAGVTVPPEEGRPGVAVSGVAPLAYIGNYRALTIPLGSETNGNSPELVAAIEAAVDDGMDVINLSVGEPAITPSRDIVAKAIDVAAAAGVVPVVAAGNEYDTFGPGSIGSPASAAGAIAVAASSGGELFGLTVRVLGPAPVPPELESFGALSSEKPAMPGRKTLVDVTTRGAGARLCGTKPLPARSLAGAVALVRRGGCTYVEKAANADAAGAIGVIVADEGRLPLGEPGGDAALPVLLVPRATGDALTRLARQTGALTIAVGGHASAVVDPSPTIAYFSSGGPTPIGLLAKPDVTAPGLEVLSSLSGADGPFGLLSGTSMAAPQVAGAAALLRERHPEWTVEQIKSALVTTGRPVRDESGHEASPTREGGGLVDLAAADAPLLFAKPQGLSFGLFDVSRGARHKTATVALTDAWDGAGAWSVSARLRTPANGARVAVPHTIAVPGRLTVEAQASRRAVEGDRAGFVVLRRGGEVRRIPFWFLVERPALPRERAVLLRRTGLHTATTGGAPALVSGYRYPAGGGELPGPERVFRFHLTRPVTNFGVAVVSHDPGAPVEPRVVAGADENRLLGVVGLPVVANAYLDGYGSPARVAGALMPAPGTYSIVFDTLRRTSPGRFTFRFWVNDVTPPRIRLAHRTGSTLVARISDRGAGVDPDSVSAAVDGDRKVPVHFDPATRRATIDLSRVSRGRHRLSLRASDYQETKNTENTGPALPNTRVLHVTVTVP